MKETAFYQIRQDNTLPLAELALLVRQAVIHLYPGTSFDEALTALHGSEEHFFISRSSRTESIVVFVTPEILDFEILERFSRKAVEALSRGREFRSQTQEFLVSIVAAEIPEKIRSKLSARQSGWSLFEYLQLQSEMEEGLALKPIHLEKVCPPKEVREMSAALPKALPPALARLPDRRLSPEELSALIDISLGLEMQSRGMSWDIPPATP